MKKVYINENGPLVSAAIYGFYRWGQKELADKALFNDTVNYVLDLGINGVQIDSPYKYHMYYTYTYLCMLLRLLVFLLVVCYY